MVARRRVAWTPQARHSVEEVIAYLDHRSPQAARELVARVTHESRSLERMAGRGRVVPERGDPSIREVFVDRYRLMYRIASDSVQILAFVHGARDFERWLREP